MQLQWEIKSTPVAIMKPESHLFGNVKSNIHKRIDQYIALTVSNVPNDLISVAPY